MLKFFLEIRAKPEEIHFQNVIKPRAPTITANGCRLLELTTNSVRFSLCVPPNLREDDVFFGDAENHELTLCLGQIFNLEEIRSALRLVEKKIPRSRLLSLAFHRWGDDLYRRLDGDFCMIVIRRDGCCRVVRDPLGICPVFFSLRESVLILSSSVSQILRLCGVKPTINGNAVMNFLTDSYPSTHQTLYSNVLRLLPGHFAEFSNGVYREHRYWYPPGTGEQYDAYVDVLRRFDVLLAQSVARRLSTTQSAVIQLSGGLDSSAIFRTALDWVSEHGNERIPDLTLFSAAYPGLPCDEREYFSETAKLGSLKHHIWEPGKRCWIDSSGMSPHEPPMIWRTDLHYGMNQVMATTGANLAVMGVGGDELVFEKDTELDLFGSRSWLDAKKWSAFRNVGLRRAVTYSLRHAAPSLADRLVGAYRRTFPQAAEIPDWMRQTLRASSDYRLAQQTTESFAFHSFAQQTTWGRITNPRLVSNLECNQRIAESHGYACAFPFLDKQLVEFFLRLPSEYRTRERLPKRIIRDAFAYRLPKAVIERTVGSDYTPLYPWQIRCNRENIKQFLLERHWHCEPYIVRRKFISLVERYSQSASIPIDVASFLRRVIDLEYSLGLILQRTKRS